ncbi:BsaA family SipW-dependent biofilm matrix protein [Enterococcus sp. LJL51]|uniref:BsaA family SipW-dependent biofilm matrix protein n=1 Tax=Enterococcus sp. LJL51 TaxID=3416656 RepID=UPI003CED29B7
MSKKKIYAKKNWSKKAINWIGQRNKLVICIATLGTVFLSTYAWFVSADSEKNTFEGASLVAEITEVFTPNYEWQPGEDTTKIVSVTNTGETPAIVRLSLYEFFLSFQIDVTDQTGDGNLKESGVTVMPSVDADNTDTWAPAVAAAGTFTQDGHNYIAAEAIISGESDRYEYDNVVRDTTAPLKYLTLNFSSNFKTAIPPAGAQKYWIYENGYFYYSEILQPGEESSPLLDSLTLSKNLPNKYKGSLYKLKIFMDAHDATPAITGAWGVNSGGDVYQMLEALIVSVED